MSVNLVKYSYKCIYASLKDTRKYMISKISNYYIEIIFSATHKKKKIFKTHSKSSISKSNIGKMRGSYQSLRNIILSSLNV